MITKKGYDLITTKTYSDDWGPLTVALLNRGGEFQPWVVAWNYDEESDYWGQGHYFSDFEDAVKWYAHYGKKNENKDKYGLLCEPKYGVGQEFSVYDDYDELKARRDELSNDGYYVTEFRYEADDDTFYTL